MSDADTDVTQALREIIWSVRSLTATMRAVHRENEQFITRTRAAARPAVPAGRDRGNIICVSLGDGRDCGDNFS